MNINTIKRRKITNKDILIKWVDMNNYNVCPNKDDLINLSKIVNISYFGVKNWFYNYKRTRYINDNVFKILNNIDINTKTEKEISKETNIHINTISFWIKSKQKKPYRNGRWSKYEIKYINFLIKLFKDGLLDIKNGTFIREYLAKELNSCPMRISKKISPKRMVFKKKGEISSEQLHLLNLYKLEFNLYKDISNNNDQELINSIDTIDIDEMLNLYDNENELISIIEFI